MDELEKQAYFKTFYVNSYDTDKNMQLRINTLFQWFTEIAWEHAKMLRFGFEELEETNFFWVLIGVNAKINKLPQWQDSLTMKSWASGVTGLYFCRNFILYDQNDICIAAVDSKWLIYDKMKMRPIVPTPADYNSIMQEHPIVDYEWTKLKPQKNLSPQMDIIAQWTDIDMHKHVNNAVYIKWIENYLGDISPQRINNISIQYLKQVKEGDKVVVYFDKENQTESKRYFCEAIIESESKPCFRAEFTLI